MARKEKDNNEGGSRGDRPEHSVVQYKWSTVMDALVMKQHGEIGTLFNTGLVDNTLNRLANEMS